MEEVEELCLSFSELNLEVTEFNNGYIVEGCLGGRPSENTMSMTCFKRQFDLMHPEFNINSNTSNIYWDEENQQRELIVLYYNKTITIKSRGYFELYGFRDLNFISSLLNDILDIWEDIVRSE